MPNRKILSHKIGPWKNYPQLQKQTTKAFFSTQVKDDPLMRSCNHASPALISSAQIHSTLVIQRDMLLDDASNDNLQNKSVFVGYKTLQNQFPRKVICSHQKWSGIQGNKMTWVRRAQTNHGLDLLKYK
jgi:hypothetical protein